MTHKAKWIDTMLKENNVLAKSYNAQEIIAVLEVRVLLLIIVIFSQTLE